jgi:WD40 repeat protein
VLWSQVAHQGGTRALVFSPDGGRLFTAGGLHSSRRDLLDEGTIRVWDVPSGRLVGTMRGHQGMIYALALSPDGTRLLSAGGHPGEGDHPFTVRLWDVASGKEVKSFEGHTRAVVGVAFEPGGKRAVSISHDLSVRLWDLDGPAGKTGRVLGTRPAIPLAVTFTAGGRLVTSWVDSRLTNWDPDRGQRKGKDDAWLVPSAVWGFARGDRKHLATANSNGTVYLLRVPLPEG